MGGGGPKVMQPLLKKYIYIPDGPYNLYALNEILMKKVRIKIDSDETNLKAKLLLHPQNVYFLMAVWLTCWD